MMEARAVAKARADQQRQAWLAEQRAQLQFGRLLMVQKEQARREYRDAKTEFTEQLTRWESSQRADFEKALTREAKRARAEYKDTEGLDAAILQWETKERGRFETTLTREKSQLTTQFQLLPASMFPDVYQRHGKQWSPAAKQPLIPSFRDVLEGWETQQRTTFREGLLSHRQQRQHQFVVDVAQWLREQPTITGGIMTGEQIVRTAYTSGGISAVVALGAGLKLDAYYLAKPEGIQRHATAIQRQQKAFEESVKEQTWLQTFMTGAFSEEAISETPFEGAVKTTVQARSPWNVMWGLTTPEGATAYKGQTWKYAGMAYELHRQGYSYAALAALGKTALTEAYGKISGAAEPFTEQDAISIVTAAMGVYSIAKIGLTLLKPMKLPAFTSQQVVSVPTIPKGVELPFQTAYRLEQAVDLAWSLETTPHTSGLTVSKIATTPDTAIAGWAKGLLVEKALITATPMSVTLRKAMYKGGLLEQVTVEPRFEQIYRPTVTTRLPYIPPAPMLVAPQMAALSVPLMLGLAVGPAKRGAPALTLKLPPPVQPFTKLKPITNVLTAPLPTFALTPTFEVSPITKMASTLITAPQQATLQQLRLNTAQATATHTPTPPRITLTVPPMPKLPRFDAPQRKRRTRARGGFRGTWFTREHDILSPRELSRKLFGPPRKGKKRKRGGDLPWF